MTRKEELDLFLVKIDELIDSKYIIADIKIVNLLKAIASSNTLVAIFKNCLQDFDYEGAYKKYLVKSPYLAENKGEFILPTSSRDLLAFVFSIIMDIDAKNIELGEFLNKYFYVDGSYSSGYNDFITKMIKPFRSTVKVLMESVIEGKVQDPVEAILEQEKKKEEQEALNKQNEEKQKELSQKTYFNKIKLLKEILLKDKTKIKQSKLNQLDKEEIILVIDMLANVIESNDKDAIIYAYISYKYVAKAHKILLFGRAKKVGRLAGEIINEL